LGLSGRSDDILTPVAPIFDQNYGFVDIAASNQNTIALRGNGRVYAFGSNNVWLHFFFIF
jgi:alpha-tubulin suppressor-like RCC1 family protein